MLGLPQRRGGRGTGGAQLAEPSWPSPADRAQLAEPSWPSPAGSPQHRLPKKQLFGVYALGSFKLLKMQRMLLKKTQCGFF